MAKKIIAKKKHLIRKSPWRLFFSPTNDNNRDTSHKNTVTNAPHMHVHTPLRACDTGEEPVEDGVGGRIYV